MGDVTTLRARHATDYSGTISIPPACVMAARDFVTVTARQRGTVNGQS
jgi:hypothetical protein